MNLTSRADVLAALREHRIDPQQARLLLQQLDSVPTQQEEYETSVNSVTRSDSIAIIGMSGRYASAANLEEYWDLIANGRDGVRALPARFAGASVDEVATPRIGYLDILPIKGIESNLIITSTEALDLETVPEELVIIGGGVIGCEFAEIFNSRGSVCRGQSD